MIRGIEAERILLGTVQPAQTIGVFEDVLKRLRDQLHYLYSDQKRYWLDTKPNLRREMESRKQNINDRDELQPMLKDRVGRTFGSQHRFSGIHIFTPSVDVPDDYGSGPRLVVLPTHAAYSRAESNQAFSEAGKILKNRGDQPRQKQNRLIFLAPDFDVVGRLKEQGRIYLAWVSIVADIESGALNQDLSHLNQAKRNRDGADKALSQLIRETYKWLIAPTEEFVKGKPELCWEVVSVSPTSPNLVQAIEEKLREEEWLIYEWSPVHLKNVLAQWYLKGGVSDVSALKVWQDCCNYLFMPRLVSDHVFQNAIALGVESRDYFGFAAGKDGDKYLGFSFGRGSIAALDGSSLLIDREAAEAYEQSLKASVPAPSTVQPGDGRGLRHGEDDAGVGDTGSPATSESEAGATASTGGSIKKQFYATVSLDPVKAKMDFATIMDEVVQQFTSKLGVDVTISVEIEARSKDGFDESLQRTVKENCNVLRFGSAEFEGE